MFRLTRLYDPDFDVLRREKRVGMLGIASYPFNRFTRIESSMQIRHATEHLLASLSTTAEPRTREELAAVARARFEARGRR